MLHTQGRPLSPDDEVRVVDAEGREVGPGEVGELTVRGPYTIRGYYRLPEHNAKAFSADGFYRTGDRVSRDKDGYLVVEGRDKDQINRGGEKIAAEEVENLLIAHPQVHDATVVAMPDSLLGERTCAFVIPRQPAPSALKLKQYLHACGLAAFKVPDRIELVPAFPKPASARSARRTCASACAASWRPAHERRLGPAVPPDADAAPAPGLLPHAGGSASFFRSWSERLPPDIDLLALQYPGREDRFNEAPATRLEDLADGAALALRDFADAPLALFGHSLGAALAYETALRLESAGAPLRHLFVSAHPAPHRQRGGALHRGDEAALLEDVRRQGGASELLEDADLRALFLPILRADYQAIETYRRAQPIALACALDVLLGEHDEEVSAAEAQAWSDASRTPARLRRSPAATST